MNFEYTFTVFTPTFNREEYLPSVYESLKAQSFKDFEWLIGDDGSTDNTRDLVGQWIAEGDLSIRYFWQKNGGKQRVRNKACPIAKGRFFFTLDSDDELMPNALERFLYHWQSIPDEKKCEYAGVAGLAVERESKKLRGGLFPLDVFDSTMVEIREKWGVVGDKCGFQLTTNMRDFPFPEFEGENFVTEALVWRRIGGLYKTRYVNEVFLLVRLSVDSLSRSETKVPRAMLNPRGTALVSNEYIAIAGTFNKRITAAANYVRCSVHAKVNIIKMLGEAEVLWMVLLAMPVGWLLYYRDLWIASRVSD